MNLCFTRYNRAHRPRRVQRRVDSQGRELCRKPQRFGSLEVWQQQLQNYMCIDKALIERLWLRFAFCFRCFAAVSWSSAVSQLLMKHRVSVSGTTTNTCFIPSSERLDLLNSCFVSTNSCFIAMNSCWNRWSTVWRSWRSSRANSLVQRMRNSNLCQHWQVIMFVNNCFNICQTKRIMGGSSTQTDPAIQGARAPGTNPLP